MGICASISLFLPRCDRLETVNSDLAARVHKMRVGASLYGRPIPDALHHSGSGVCAACVTPVRAPIFSGL